MVGLEGITPKILTLHILTYFKILIYWCPIYITFCMGHNGIMLEERKAKILINKAAGKADQRAKAIVWCCHRWGRNSWVSQKTAVKARCNLKENVSPSAGQVQESMELSSMKRETENTTGWFLIKWLCVKKGVMILKYTNTSWCSKQIYCPSCRKLVTGYEDKDGITKNDRRSMWSDYDSKDNGLQIWADWCVCTMQIREHLAIEWVRHNDGMVEMKQTT